MTEIETTIPGRRITAGPTELRIENTNTGGMIWARLLNDDAKKVADALDPDRGKGTYPSGSQADEMARAIDRLTAERDEANARADAAEARVRELREQVQRSGSIVYTVEEQDIEAEGRRVEVVDTGRQFNIRIQGQPVNAIKSSTEAREKAQRHIEAAARCEAIARRIETDTAVDPVEAKAIELHQVAYGGRIGFGHATLNAQEMFRSLARYVLGQEADHA